MAIVWTQTGPFRLQPFTTKAELEASILKVKHELFGLPESISTISGSEQKSQETLFTSFNRWIRQYFKPIMQTT